ncbi:hypothetical protein [Aeromicrobium sp. 179-A 4D2 NHS]|uniref:hypothetical protein n=1 Tax=Aeromicrobium sp. 179-A 4D2 NHS TaxID=3142375 RepID=UPI0039A2738E
MSIPARRLPVALALAALLSAAAYASWVGLSAWQASKVRITASELLTCADPRSVVTSDEEKGWDAEEDPADLQGAVQVVKLDRRLDCMLRTQVVNEAKVDVVVERLTWPLLGPRNDYGARVSWSHQGGPELTPNSGLDATFDVTGYDALEPDLNQFAVRLTFAPGCQSPGVGSISESPRATISVLGRRHTITAVGQGVGYAGTPDTNCDTDVSGS